MTSESHTYARVSAQLILKRELGFEKSARGMPLPKSLGSDEIFGRHGQTTCPTSLQCAWMHCSLAGLRGQCGRNSVSNAAVCRRYLGQHNHLHHLPSSVGEGGENGSARSKLGRMSRGSDKWSWDSAGIPVCSIHRHVSLCASQRTLTPWERPPFQRRRCKTQLPVRQIHSPNRPSPMPDKQAPRPKVPRQHLLSRLGKRQLRWPQHRWQQPTSKRSISLSWARLGLGKPASSTMPREPI